MDPITGMAIGGAVVGGAASYFGQKETNSANAEMNAFNNMMNHEEMVQHRRWQETMANTAHEREVADLKRAGLNPILSARGSGAATPSGGAATMNAARMEDALGKGVSSAVSSASLMKDLEMADSQKALNASAIQTQQSQQDVNAASAQKTMQDTIKLAQDNNIREPALADMRDAAAQQAKADLKKAKIDNQMATFDAFQVRSKNLFETGGALKDALNPLKGILNGPGKNIPPSGEIFKNRNGQEGFYDRSGKYHKTK